MTERLPAICTPEVIKAAYRPGLRIVWEEGGLQEVWEIVAVDEEMATTRFIQAHGSQLERTARFEDLSSHSSFPVGTELTKEDFETPAGRFHGTHPTLRRRAGSSTSTSETTLPARP
jgi:hypothetical protein